MRQSGRSAHWLFRHAKGLPYVCHYQSYGTKEGLLICAKHCTRGVCLTATHRYTGRLVAQEVMSLGDWFVLEPGVREGIFMSFFKRPSKAVTPVGPGGSMGVDVDLAREAPTLACYLCADSWPDGEVRQRSSLVLFYEDGLYKVCLSEKDTNMTLWASARTFEGIVGALEARLTEDTPDWRKKRPWNKKS